jgi:UDP-N-acetylmuramoyl-tripeptide--D-alanyl-D-alanine ligase
MTQEQLKEYVKMCGAFIIKLIAKLIVMRHRPKIVAITGTVGKTTTKDMVATVLRTRFSVRKNIKSYNSQMGIALTIIGCESAGADRWGWVKIAWRGIVALFRRAYPTWLVLEIGVDGPGDMDILAGWLHPRIAIVTAFGEIPAHVENFESPEHVMAEKAKIVNYIERGGALLLNADDPNVMKLKAKASCKVYTFGIRAEADINATHAHCVYNEINVHRPVTGLNFKMNFEGHSIPFTLSGVLGDGYVYPVISSVMLGVSLGIPVVESAQALSSYAPARGRMNILAGRNNSMIIDDSYNASPLSMQSALATLKKVEPRGLKIAVIGDMLEIGRYSHSAHKQLGELIAKVPVDFLVTVGIRAEIAAEAAYLAKLHKSKIRCFKSAENALDEVQKLQKKTKGSIILIKGSRAMGMEKIVAGVI